MTLSFPLRIPAGLMLCLAAIITGPPKSLPADDLSLTPEALDFFESKVRPLLIQHCYECHSREGDDVGGSFLVDSAAGVRRGGDLGPAIIEGDPDASLLIKAIEYQNADLQMPPDGKLDPGAIETLRQWIRLGAPDPRTESESATISGRSPMDRDPSTHWAFVKPRRIDGARQHDNDFRPETSSRDPIDSVIAIRGGEQGLRPSPDAGRETLIRRLYFDLSGLPPDSETITRFVQSDDPAAYHRLVDSLLAMPDFGERFGRHWLDVARYADTLGYATAGKTRQIEGSERYRNWVIRSFANDRPYDEMIRMQLAADRFAPDDQRDDLDAMGFLTIGRRFLNTLDTIDDRIDVISRGLIGLTVSCARCHDHKFDPIPTQDYYSLFSILSNSHEPNDGESPLMMVDRPRTQDHHVLVRGLAGNPGPVAPRRYLTALSDSDEDVFRDGSGRGELATRIASPDNPLTARVLVNRLWMHLIGRPLVDSPSDFGFRTSPPRVPEVLDDLAAEFSEHWSIKRIVRRIVLTKTYRQSSKTTPDSIRKDPDNAWLCRGNRRRRDFESLRDNLLTAAGCLDRTIGGKSTEITLDSLAPRRTIYAKIDRQNLPSIFRTFDFASPDAHSAGRYYTTVPQQALYLINSKQMSQLARRVADRSRTSISTKNAPPSDASIDALFRHVLRRSPTPDERRLAVDFVRQPARPLALNADARRYWSYGTAEIGEDSKVKNFRAFPIFRRGQWQVAEKFPGDGPLGYANLGQENGHPGTGKGGAVIRRFTAPLSGTVRIVGMMGHRSRKGDGVRTQIWVGKESVFDQIAKSNNRPYGPLIAWIEKGQHIDFVASPGKTSDHDTFFWRIRVNLSGSDGEVIESESTRDFSGPLDAAADQSLDRFAQLAQVLLMSNELAFVD